MRKTITKYIFGTLLLSLPLSGLAQDSTAVFSNCLVDSLNGKERKELAKWIFMSIAVHPTIENYAVISKNERLNNDKNIGALITKLLTKECPKELSLATKDNPLAMQKGFELVGQVAMQEIMTNESTMQALAEYAKYADQEEIAKAAAAK